MCTFDIRENHSPWFPFSRDIIDPVVPFALRLSSNLMVGVVRIYREQTRIVWGKWPILLFVFFFDPG